MRHFTLVVIAVVAVCSVNAWAATASFQETTADANGDYLWSNADNWGGSPPTGLADRAYLNSVTAVLYSTQAVDQLRLPSSSGAATLTLRDGANLTVGEASDGFSPLGVGQGGGSGTLNIEGGVLSVPSLYSHGAFAIGRTSTSATSWVYQSGGTVDAPGLIVLGRSDTGAGEYYFSGGTINCGSLNITHDTQLSSSLLEISGGDFNASGTGYKSGINIYDGGTLRIIGGLATIDVAGSLWSGGFQSTLAYDDTTTLSFEVNATGISTINALDWSITSTVLGNSILELLADGALAGTYTLVHTIDEVTSADLAELNVIGNANFTNLQVVDVAGDGTSGYDVTVDYVPEPATMTLLAFGAVAMLRRKR